MILITACSSVCSYNLYKVFSDDMRREIILQYCGRCLPLEIEVTVPRPPKMTTSKLALLERGQLARIELRTTTNTSLG